MNECESQLKGDYFQSSIDEYLKVFNTLQENLNIMKRVALLLLMILSNLTVYCQNKSEFTDYNLPVKDQQVFYEFIDSTTTKGKSQEQIYYAGQKAFVEVFNDSKSVIEIDNKTDGHITGKGIVKDTYSIGFITPNTDAVKFIIDFKSKDGKYRLQFYNFSSTFPNEAHFSPLDKVLNFWNKSWRIRFFKSFDQAMRQSIDQFNKALVRNLSSHGSDF